jgi:tetratricopeptide (TPR) repeat protein
MGLIALGAAGVAVLWRRLYPRGPAPVRGGARRGVAWTGAVLLVCLGVLTWRRSAVFTGGVPVWADTVSKNPGSWMPRHNLGALLIEQGRAADAVPHLRAANELKRNDPDIEIRLGLALALTGETERGIALVRKGVWANPYVGRGYFVLARIYERLGDDAEAIRWYEMGLNWTRDPQLRTDLARAYDRTGQPEKAAAAYAQAMREATAAP